MDVEIWSDIACPWCYVGRRRFEAALERFDHRDQVTVTWRSFELDPTAPAEREDLTQHLADKYGRTREQALEMHAQMAATAREDGLEFDFTHIRGGNTFDAHRLTHLAAEHGLQDAMKERLQAAYLSEGQLLSDHDTLVRLAIEVGLPEDEVRTMLTEEQRFADAVRLDERTAQAMGVQGVPFFVIDRQIGASGAQPADTLLAFLEEGWRRRSAAAVGSPAA